MTNQDEVPPQAHIGHPTIRIRLIGPVALIHPIHAPTRAQLTPAGDLLHPHDHMNIFNISPLSKFDHEISRVVSTSYNVFTLGVRR
ncbi:hypothetical protein SMMN14_06524 [Sphaerulina musiva]